MIDRGRAVGAVSKVADESYRDGQRAAFTEVEKLALSCSTVDDFIVGLDALRRRLFPSAALEEETP